MSDGSSLDGVIGFLGAGRMAQALGGGFVEAGLVPPDRVVAYDPSPEAAAAFSTAVGNPSASLNDPSEVVGAARIVFLAVKPAYVADSLSAVSPGWRPDEQMLVSVAAGVSLAKLEGALPSGSAVVRVMPNTPCLIGQGACCYALGAHASAEAGSEVGRLLGAVGYASETPESMLDAVTGLSGSGPAFVYTVIEALADGGVRAGLPRDLAAELAARTVSGAAQMVLTTGDHPATLRDAVASPGGTTIAGLAELERRGLRAALIEGVAAAAHRSAELGAN